MYINFTKFLSFAFILSSKCLNLIRSELCGCNLADHVCEIGCCCDPDCDSASQQVFVECINSNSRNQSDICIRNSVLFSSNIQLISWTNSSFICFQPDLYSSQNFYKTPDLVDNFSQTSNLIAKYTIGNFSTTLKNTAFDSPYFVGSKLIAYFDTIRAFGFLSLPTGDTLNFGVNRTIAKATILNLMDSGTSCIAIPTISQIIGSQSLVTDASLLKTVPDNANNLVTPIQSGVSSLLPATCVDSAGNSITCPSSSSFSSGACLNVITMLTLSFAFQNRVITQVSVQAVVTNSLSSNFNQIYHVVFYQSLKIPTAMVSVPKATDQRSGNPGYLDQSPVVAGVLSLDRSSITLNPMDFSGRTNLPVSWWTVPGLGACSVAFATANLAPILFKENMRSHCLISILSSFADTPGACASLDMNIKQILNSGTNQINRVSRFGNFSTTNLSDWLTVSVIDETLSIVQSQRKCQNVTIGQRIIIPYAYTGSISDPQAQIKGVRIQFIKGTIEFKCGGPYCARNNNDLPQNFPIFSAVDFVDQTKTFSSEVDTSYDRRLPNNVFFPFAGNYGHDLQIINIFETG